MAEKRLHLYYFYFSLKRVLYFLYTKYFLIYQYPNHFFYSKFVHNFVEKLLLKNIADNQYFILKLKHFWTILQ